MILWCVGWVVGVFLGGLGVGGLFLVVVFFTLEEGRRVCFRPIFCLLYLLLLFSALALFTARAVLLRGDHARLQMAPRRHVDGTSFCLIIQ